MTAASANTKAGMISAFLCMITAATVITAAATQAAPQQQQPGATSAPGKPPTSPPTPLPRGPIAVYDGACARCHGPNGSFYGPTLGQGKTDEQLRTVVKDMAEGPGNETLTPAELEAQTAYHRALIRKEPFIVVLKRSGEQIEGEVTPGATVAIRRAGAAPASEKAAKVDGSRWSLRIPGLKAADTLLVTARQGKTEVRINTAQQLWSHTQPLPPPPQK